MLPPELATVLATVVLGLLVLAVVARDGWRRMTEPRDARAGHDVAHARVVLPPTPSTFEQAESERRWGATAVVSPELRERFDQLDRRARRRAAAAVGLSPDEEAAVALARRPADTRRGEVEAAAAGAGFLGGRALLQLNAAAHDEQAALTRVLGLERALVLRATERGIYRDFLASEAARKAPGPVTDFAQRRMLFLRMGRPPALTALDGGAGGSLSFSR